MASAGPSYFHPISYLCGLVHNCHPEGHKLLACQATPGVLTTYSMVLSIQDVDDDREVGVKSTALLFGPRPKPWLVGFATGMTSLLLLAGLNAGQAWPYFMGVGVCASHLAWQVHICVLQFVCLLQMFLEWGVSVSCAL